MAPRLSSAADSFAEDDLDGATPVVVLGFNIWQSRYAGDKGVLGKTIKVNDLPATVVGVMPQGMQFPPNTDLWLPLGQATINRGQSRQVRNYQVIARLADGVTIQQARSELTTITARLARDYPQTNQGIEPTIVTYNERVNGQQIRLVFWSLMGAVGFVLLIACSNVANLLLARSAERAKEVGVRLSLGASRGRVIRQLLVESVMLSLIGGLLGLPLAYAGIRVFDSLTQNVGKPYWMEFSIDPTVLLFFFGVCFATGDHLRAGSGAARVEDEPQRGAEGRRALRVERDQGATAGRTVCSSCRSRSRWCCSRAPDS